MAHAQYLGVRIYPTARAPPWSLGKSGSVAEKRCSILSSLIQSATTASNTLADRVEARREALAELGIHGPTVKLDASIAEIDMTDLQRNRGALA